MENDFNEAVSAFLVQAKPKQTKASTIAGTCASLWPGKSGQPSSALCLNLLSPVRFFLFSVQACVACKQWECMYLSTRPCCGNCKARIQQTTCKTASMRRKRMKRRSDITLTVTIGFGPTTGSCERKTSLANFQLQEGSVWNTNMHTLYPKNLRDHLVPAPPPAILQPLHCE